MIIDSASVNLQASLQTQHASRRGDADEVEHAGGHKRGHRVHHGHDDRLTLSESGKTKTNASQALDQSAAFGPQDNFAVQIIRRMVKEITGQDFQLFNPGQLAENKAQSASGDGVQATAQPQAQQLSPVAGQNPPATQGTAAYQQTLAYFESQTTSFSAQGSINTKDGQSLSFSFSLNMSHTFYSQTSVSAQGQQPEGDSGKEPFAFSFDGLAAELTTTEFHFDIQSSSGLASPNAPKNSGSGVLTIDSAPDAKPAKPANTADSSPATAQSIVDPLNKPATPVEPDNNRDILAKYLGSLTDLAEQPKAPTASTQSPNAGFYFSAQYQSISLQMLNLVA